jgi:hypothetical protein
LLDRQILILVPVKQVQDLPALILGQRGRLVPVLVRDRDGHRLVVLVATTDPVIGRPWQADQLTPPLDRDLLSGQSSHRID